ncbi:MAG: peptidase domain-containing ABC transporter [Lactobacillales bacterium]|nr:peptidase domain-containing ABC transporter [Lactobacillales bacterium]
MVKYPFVKQKDLKDCGVCSLLMILKYYDAYIPIEKLRDMTFTSKNGVTAFHLIEAAKQIGFISQGLKVTNLENIPLPCIAHVTIDNSFNHYVVIYEIDYEKQELLIADPASRIKKISFKDFNLIFNKVIITFKKYKKLLNIPNNKKLLYSISNLLIKNKTNFIKIVVLSFFIILFSIITSFYIEIVLNKINTSNSLLFIIFTIFCLIHILKNLFDYIRGKILIKVQNDIELSLSNEIFKNIISLPYKYFKNRTTGEILTRVNDLSIITDIIIKIIVTILLDLLLSIFACIFLFNINRSLFMISSIVIIFYILIVLKFQNELKIKLEKIKEEKASLNSYIVENISGFETLKGLSIEDNIINNYKIRNNKYIKLSKDYENIYNKENLLKNLLEEIGICILVLVGSLLVMKKQITIGNLITFISLFSYYISPLKNIVELNKDIKDAKISFNRLNEIIYDLKSNNTFLKLPFNNINIKNLTYSYNKYNNVFENINLNINQNEKIMLIGSSGMGKSTILKLLKKYYQVDNNKIFIDDVDINSISEDEINKNITYVSQQEILFTDTLYNNLVLNRKIKNNKILSVVKDTKLNFIDKNLKLNMFIEENGFNLSGGQRQRIVLARSLLNDFKILLLDEALSEVDQKTERKILKNIFKRYKNKTIILVSHRLDNKDLFDRVISF